MRTYHSTFKIALKQYFIIINFSLMGKKFLGACEFSHRALRSKSSPFASRPAVGFPLQSLAQESAEGFAKTTVL